MDTALLHIWVYTRIKQFATTRGVFVYMIHKNILIRREKYNIHNIRRGDVCGRTRRKHQPRRGTHMSTHTVYMRTRETVPHTRNEWSSSSSLSFLSSSSPPTSFSIYSSSSSSPFSSLRCSSVVASSLYITRHSYRRKRTKPGVTP